MRPGDGAGRRLQLLVGSVLALGALAVLASLAAVWRGDAVPVPALVVALVLLVAVGDSVTVRVRIRSARHAMTWTDAAVLVGLVAASAEWVVLATVTGVALSKALRRVRPVRLLFGVAVNAVHAGVGGLVLAASGPSSTAVNPARVAALGFAFLAMTLVNELLTVPAIAFSARTRVIERFLDNWDIQLITLIGRFGAATLAVLLLNVEPQFLYALPALVLCGHLWHERWVRTRAERRAWQRLAAATESFTSVELDTVLRSAVGKGAELFSADEVEVEVWLEGRRRLVCGSREEIIFDGAAEDAPVDALGTHEVPLRGYAGSADIGVLRLRFRDEIQLAEREQAVLQTFASALDTAVRNAAAYERLRQATANYAYAATHDPLTGLANRRELEQRVAAALDNRVDGVSALLFVDLKRFKEVNDVLGHLRGDRVLVEVAERLAETVGEHDLVARFGGDEFAVLMRVDAPASAEHRAEALLDALREPIDVEGLPVTVEANAGLAVGTQDAMELVRRADVAMYQAKRSGRRLAGYVAAEDPGDRDRLALGGQLAAAVSGRQFLLFYQPIVDLASGQVVAAEALARWRHPQWGELGPRRFLDTVERSGQLPAFTAAVLDLALSAADGWRAAGHDLVVSVNVSVRSLLDHSLADQVAGALARHGTPADRLCLELTETLAVSRLGVVDEVLARLHGLGVRLALDDFGTGFSSLAMLSRVPVDQLKIDRQFVMGMNSLPQAQVVVRSTVELGRGLDLAVVAEGVETPGQRRMLWELGCAAGQGHLFSRPVPADRLLALLRQGCAGRSGALVAPLHDQARVVRLPRSRHPGPDQAEDTAVRRLP